MVWPEACNSCATSSAGITNLPFRGQDSADDAPLPETDADETDASTTARTSLAAHRRRSGE
jgi:hypothetical protein